MQRAITKILKYLFSFFTFLIRQVLPISTVIVKTKKPRLMAFLAALLLLRAAAALQLAADPPPSDPTLGFSVLHNDGLRVNPLHIV